MRVCVFLWLGLISLIGKDVIAMREVTKNSLQFKRPQLTTPVSQNIWQRIKSSFNWKRTVNNVNVKGAIELPRSVVLKALLKSGLARDFNSKTSALFEKQVNDWYRDHGYLVSSVVKPLKPPTKGLLTINVVEPIIGNNPVKLTYYKRSKMDNDVANISKSNKGVTRASTVAFALGLEKGKPLRWSQDKFEHLKNSGLFQKILLKDVIPNKKEKTIHLTMDVLERDSFIYFEPGFTGSFADRTLRGILKFKHDNLFGLGHVFGCDFSYTNKQPEGMLSYENDRFGRIGGFRMSAYQRLKKNHIQTSSSTTATASPTYRRLRGVKTNLRVFSQRMNVGVPWLQLRSMVQSIGMKAEATEGKDETHPPHVLSCIQTTTDIRLSNSIQSMNAFVTLHGNTGISGSGSAHSGDHDQSKLSYLKQFFTSKISAQRMVTIDQDVDLKLKANLVKQSESVPRQERHYPSVRGCDTASFITDSTTGDIAVKEWKDVKVELHRPLGRKLDGVLFVDTAVLQKDSDYRNQVLTSCGVGVMIGPFKVEVARHRAKNHIHVGLR